VSAVVHQRTIYTAQWVLPVSSPPIVDGAVIVEGAHIAYVGAAAGAPRVEGDRTVDLGAAILLPGLVNAHTHLELTAMRGFLEGLAFREWLVTLNAARRDCFVAESLHDSACAGIEEGLRNGITTFADTTESGAPLAAMRELGVRGIAYLEVFGPDPARAEASMQAFIPRVHALRMGDTELVQTGVSPHAPYTVSAPLFRRVAEFSRADQLPVAVHVAESAAESRFVSEGEGPFADGQRARGIAVAAQARSPIALLDATGLLAERPLLIHAIQVDGDDVARVADCGARVVHCPISNLKLAQGIAPLEWYLDGGIAVGLGTDSVASNDRMDLLGEARQAALLQALRRGVPDALSAQAVVALATLGGARALGLETQIGTLEVGKAADLAAFPIEHPDLRPVHDPAVTLVHVLAGAVRASLTVVAGRERVRDGHVVGADLARHARMDALGERLRLWRKVHFAS